MTTSSGQSVPSERIPPSASPLRAGSGAVEVGGRVPGVATVRGLPAAFLDVPEALPEQGEHVFVIEGVEDHPAFPPGADNADVAEQTKLMGDGRFGDRQLVGNVADAQLGPGERIEDANTRGISEYPEGLGQFIDDMCIELRHMNTCSYVNMNPCPSWRPSGTMGGCAHLRRAQSRTYTQWGRESFPERIEMTRGPISRSTR